MDGQQAAAILRVGQQATKDEIRQAFRARAKVLHPDAGPAGSMERFITLRLAFDRLLADAPASAGPAGVDRPRGRSPFESGGATTESSRATIDLTDTNDRRPRRPAGPAGTAPKRDARGLSFEDHLRAALARP